MVLAPIYQGFVMSIKTVLKPCQFCRGNGRRKHVLLLCNISDKFPSQAEGGKHVILSKIIGWN